MKCMLPWSAHILPILNDKINKNITKKGLPPVLEVSLCLKKVFALMFYFDTLCFFPHRDSYFVQEGENKEADCPYAERYD